MPSPPAALDPAEWLESSEWLARARRLGPLPCSYLGRRRLSAPPAEAVAPLAGWLSAWLDRSWEEAGRPDPFTAVVVSGDQGGLAAQLLAGSPRCAPALRYVVVDPDREGMEPPAELVRSVRLEEPAFLYPASARPDEEADSRAEGPPPDEFDLEERPPARGIGPLTTFLHEVPVLGEGEGTVVAVEVLSRLAYDLYEQGTDGWQEVRLAAGDDELVEMVVPAPPDGPPHQAATGADRWRHQTGAAGWLRRILPLAAGGRVAVVDRWGEPDGLDLEQLRQVRQPLDDRLGVVAGTPWSVIAWRLG